MGQELVDEVLLANGRQGIVNGKPDNLIGSANHRTLHLNGTGVVWRRRPKANLTSAAHGDVATGTVVRRSIAGRMQDWRQSRQTVAVSAAIAFRLHLILWPTEKVRERLDVVHPL